MAAILTNGFPRPSLPSYCHSPSPSLDRTTLARLTSSHAAARAGPPRPAFPAFLAGAGIAREPAPVSHHPLVGGPVVETDLMFDHQVSSSEGRCGAHTL